jgi:hypothetical protein
MVGESIRFTSIFFYNSSKRLQTRELGTGWGGIELACLLAANDEEES